MITVEKANIVLFDQIYLLLERFNNPNLTKSDFKHMFDAHWSSDYDHCGYVLLDGGKVVGFLGTLFSERVIEGKLRKFCNLTSWIVENDYRQHSLRLLLPVLNLRHRTLTSVTPSKGASIIFKKFKFKTLEKSHRIFFLSYRCLSVFLNFNISNDKSVIHSHLNKNDLALFHDHCLPLCQHLIIYHKHNRDDYCYLVFNKIKKKKLRFTQVLYVNNIIIFRKVFPCIQLFFLKKNRTLLTLIDDRLLKDVSFGGFKYQLRVAKLYRSDELNVDKIDNLYTEMCLLGI